MTGDVSFENGADITIIDSTDATTRIQITARGIQNEFNDADRVYTTDGDTTKLKTINGQSLFGSGNIEITGGTSGNYISKSGDSGMTGNYTYSSSSRITAGEFYETSDRNLKENISSISEEDVNKARNIDIVEFNFKGKDTKKYGVIAQDLESAGLENLVQSNDEGTKSVDYISMLCLKIAELEKRVKELENGCK